MPHDQPIRLILVPCACAGCSRPRRRDRGRRPSSNDRLVGFRRLAHLGRPGRAAIASDIDEIDIVTAHRDQIHHRHALDRQVEGGFRGIGRAVHKQQDLVGRSSPGRRDACCARIAGCPHPPTGSWRRMSQAWALRRSPREAGLPQKVPSETKKKAAKAWRASNTSRNVYWSMTRKSGYRFSEKVMLDISPMLDGIRGRCQEKRMRGQCCVRRPARQAG